MEKRGLFSLYHKVAIITGAARGMGRSMATGLARAGADAMLVDVLGDRLEHTARKIGEETGRQVGYQVMDLADVASLNDLVTACLDQFGHVDILVNNAAATVRKPFLEISPEEYDRVMAVNAKATYFLSQSVAKVMIDQGKGGKIINMASLTSEIGMLNLSAYGTSKGGIYALTKALSVELAPYSICVNAIAPGFFLTDLTAPVWETGLMREWVKSRIPFGRPGEPDDIIGTAIYLASHASDYLTGRVIFLDGGWMAS
jgi:NAD(P)-dependent dehydrogenase (short-subunit alcohol dehydrogenase family)